MVRAVRTLVAAARLSHNNFYIPGRSDSGTATISPVPAVTWQRMENGLGYISITSFVEDRAERDRLDVAFADLADAPGLVIDLRGNGGGNLSLAMRLGDHLFGAGTKAGYFATRTRLDAAGVISMDELPQSAYVPFEAYTIDAFQSALAETGAVSLVTGGRAPLYAGRVALLINGASASSSEAMAAVLKESGRARLFGTRSAGEMLSSKVFAIDDAYVMRLAFADFRTPRGAVVEEVGVTPDEVVGGDEAAVMAAATRWLLRRL
jgi:C-terminal processing protease CtpA/Prc